MENNKVMWPGWETVRLIGRGSFGAVYEIEREVFGHKEKAALKVITIPQSDSDIEELYDNGYDEASVTATFKSHLQSVVNEYSLMREMNGSANVVNCDDFRIVQHDDSIGWDIFIKMELLTPITKVLDKQPSDAKVTQVARDMCNALILCKKYGIIHRDIKPQNIFVSKNGDYKLGDFGIAKTIEKTSGGTKIGTYKYMAPEVYNNQPYSLTADIYSLGLVLHWMLNERRSPFMPLPPAPAIASQEDEARVKRFNGTPIPAPAHGSEELKRIVLKACSYAPKGRYQSAEEMLRDLDALGGGSPAMIRSDEAAADENATVLATYEDEASNEEETVSVYGLEKKEETKSEEETVGIFTEKPSVSKKDKPKKRGSLPVLIGIAAVFALVVCFFTVHRWSVKVHVMAAAEDLSEIEDDAKSDQFFWGQTTYKRRDVTSVSFHGTTKAAPSNAWDVSEAKDRTVLAWMDSGNLHVAANGEIAPNSNASWMFAYFENLKEVDFGDCFDTTNVTNMRAMFQECNNLTSLDVSGFYTANVTNMRAMFSGCSSLTDLDVSGFDTSKVTDMGWMFYGCGSLNSLDVSGFDTSKVTDMGFMFNKCSSLTSLDVSGFNTRNVTNMYSMFSDCSSLTSLDVSGFDTSKVTHMGFMFNKCSSLTYLDVSGFDTANVTNMSAMFQACNNLTSLDVSGFDTSKVTDMGWMFWGCSSLTSLDISGFNTRNVTNMDWMFFMCSNLTSLDVSGFYTANVTNMCEMFRECNNLTSLDVSGFYTANVTNMCSMFSGCSSLTDLDVSGFDTSKVTDMGWMFYGCGSLNSLDVSGFDTSKVTDMGFMFNKCSSLTSLDVSGFNTSKVTDMEAMFNNCSSIVYLDVSGFYTSNVRNMRWMFYGCSSLTSLDLSKFDTSKVTDMDVMFYGCSSLTNLKCTDSKILAEYEKR